MKIQGLLGGKCVNCYWSHRLKGEYIQFQVNVINV